MTKNNDDQAAPTRLGGLVGNAARDEKLIQVNDHLWVSKDISDSILITTEAGNVVVNAGMPGNGELHRQRFRGINQLPIEYLIITQCHGDHFGGAVALRDPGTRIITHQRYQECREYWRILHDFYSRRSNKLWGSMIKNQGEIKAKIQEITADITFEEHHSLTLGGRQFELYAAPGGESEDGVIVWLPQDRTLISGNLFGPIFANMPNLYTLRGDKIRSAQRFIKTLDFVRGLQPAVLVTGHEVITGEQQIQDALTKVREAVLFVFNYTIDGMNAGVDVLTLMNDIVVPEHLRIGQSHGKFSWCVRAIWEEYAGWFHYDATTSLYAVPAASVAADLVELAGGADVLAARAEDYLAKQLPLQALHLLNTALTVEPANTRAMHAKVAAHEQLLAASKGENFSEVMWLKSEIAAAQA
jgi:alkyl sulfatase BDS1-like metallo-beta-lactamase superfamily hydrolase